MSITVQFFASLREQLGKQQLTLEYDVLKQETLANKNPVDVLSVWNKASDGLPMPKNTLCAVNMEYVKPDSVVNDGDEVAFFPPVTGG